MVLKLLIKYKNLSNFQSHKHIYSSLFEIKKVRNCQYKSMQISPQRTLPCNIKLQYDNYSNSDECKVRKVFYYYYGE